MRAAHRARVSLPQRVREGILHCLKVFVAVRLGLFAIALLGVGLLPAFEAVSVPGWPAPQPSDPGWHNAFTAWERFDALWFLRIAEGGYRIGDGSAAFFPLYPLLVRMVSWLIGGHPLAASLMVSNASFLAALIALYFLTASDVSEDVARKTTLYLAVFPTSFFFFAPYSESTFLLLVVASFWAARRDRWALAGVLGGFAALTRSIGLILLPALIVEAVHQRIERRAPLLPRVLASGLVGLGTLSYLAFWALKAGSWLAPINQQATWERIGMWPWVSFVSGSSLAFRYPGQYPGAYWLLDWLIVVPMLVAAVYALFRFRPAYRIYLWGGLLLPLSFVFPDRPLMSMPRFLLPLFPAFWAMAVAADRRMFLHDVVVAVGAAGLGLLTVLYVNWYYIF